MKYFIVLIIATVLLVGCADSASGGYNDGQIHDWIITNNNDGFPETILEKTDTDTGNSVYRYQSYDGLDFITTDGSDPQGVQ